MAKDTTRTMGLDVGDRLSRYVVLEEGGAKAAEGTVATTPAAMGRLFLEEAGKVVIEVGTHSRWISALARELGREVVVAQARRLERLSPSGKKNDREDAHALAELSRLGSSHLRPVRHRGAKAQADLAVVRARDTLVRASTQLINHVRGVVKSVALRVPSARRERFPAKAREVLPPALLPALEPLLAQIESLAASIAAYDAAIEALIEKDHTDAQRLQEVPGVGPITALTFVLTLEDPSRFRKSRDVGPYLGLVPRQFDSGTSRPELPISRAGDPFLRRLLVQCAHGLIRHGPATALGRWAIQRTEHSGTSQKKRIVVALARKIAVLLHRLWARGETYDRNHGLATA